MISTNVLIRCRARAIVRLVIAGLEYRLRRQTSCCRRQSITASWGGIELHGRGINSVLQSNPGCHRNYKRRVLVHSRVTEVARFREGRTRALTCKPEDLPRQ